MLNTSATSSSSGSGAGGGGRAGSSLLSSPFSSSNLSGQLGAAQPAPRRSWFPNILPVQPAVEDPTPDLEEEIRLLRLQDADETEEAEEVTEKSDLDAAAEDRAMPLAFDALRHEEDVAGADPEEQSWRMRERMKTVSVALVICLNVGVDPPDVTKTQPCARAECWVDPTTLNPQRAIEQIGNNLQRQYERWQPRARYKLSLDPPLEEVRRLATGLRRNAREERVLFHYNGHGVPKPTANGEIWVFNRNYTQYIPLSLYDLQSWMGSPSIFVYDCSNAGIIVQAFEQFADQHEREYIEQINSQGMTSADLPPPILQRNCIQLAACSATQILPMNPELPADLFTSCLTTPIKMALRWFVMQGHGRLSPSVTVEMLDKIPGQFGDRRTMLGELNWIFTAITDTIAWNTLPRDLFQKLFRQDLLVASLFRNFLLAERIMRSYDCTPISQPSLPHTHLHPMWKAWDLAVDVSLSQLPGILEGGSGRTYRSSTFFEEQLTAFEVWLKHGEEGRPPPEQLPIVLQVLLSQAHRLRALDLLGRFLDLGPWAVNLALSVGIFPYVLKLLQSSARELRPLLVSIWAKILAVDPSCQTDLIRDSSHKYFLSVLQDDQGSVASEHRTWAAFILATIVHNFPQGQQEAEQHNLISICLEHLEDGGSSGGGDHPLLRRWLAVALGRTWDRYEKARWRGVRDNAHSRLLELLRDPVPEVRAAAVFALGTFVNACQERTEHANSLDHSVALHLWNSCRDDASPIVRAELVLALSYFVMAFEANFVTVARIALQESTPPPALGLGGGQSSTTASPNKMSSSTSSPSLNQMAGATSSPNLAANAATGNFGSSAALASGIGGSGGVYQRIWGGLRQLAADPYPQVSSMSESLLIYLKVKAREKERFSRLGGSILEGGGSPSSSTGSRIKQSSSSSVHHPGAAGQGGGAGAAGGATSSVPSSPARASFMVGTSPPPAQAPVPQQRSSPQQQQQQDGGAMGLRTLSSDSASSLTASPAQRGFASTPGGSSSLRRAGTRSHNPSPTSTQTGRDLRAPELRTEFLPWSSKYFTRQLMKHQCNDCDCDHESARHWSKAWLYKRNLEVRSEAERQRDWLKTRMCRLDELTSSFQTSFVPRLVLFHPYNNQLAVAGAKRILVQDLDLGTTICDIEMRERRHVRSQFTSLSYVNAHDEALLLAGSDDGFLRVYKDLQKDELEAAASPTTTAKIKLVTAWNALREILPATRQQQQQQQHNFGMSAAWEQKSLTIAVGGGDCKFVRLWDANHELKVADIATGGGSAGDSSSVLSCISFSNQSPDLLTAGFSDGSVKVFDVRTSGRSNSGGMASSSSSSAAVLQHREHSGYPVLDCQLQDSGGFAGLVVSGAADGSVRVSDPRRGSRAPTAKSLSLGQPVSSLALHRRAFAVAARTASSSQHGGGGTVVHTLLGGGAQLGSFKAPAEGGGLLGSGSRGASSSAKGPSGCVAFHPHLIQLATGGSSAGGSGSVGVYRLRRTV